MAGILKVDTLQRVGSDSDQITLSSSGVNLFNPIIKSSSGTTAATVDGSGHILMPTRPVFYAYMSSGSFAPAASNSTKTPLNTTLVNTGNCWSTTDHQFTAPVAGTYSITWGFTFQDSDNARYVASRIYKNGSQLGSAHRQSQPTAQGGNQYDGIDGINMILTFSANETFYIILQPSSTLTVAAEFGTYMSGFLIG